MQSIILGKLLQSDPSQDAETAALVATPNLKGHAIPYIIRLSRAPGMTIAEVDTALERFFTIDSKLQGQIVENAFASWKNFEREVGALDALDLYGCIPSAEQTPWQQEAITHATQLATLQTPEQIWEFATPREAVVRKQNEDILIQVTFDCLWDREHGLSITILNGTSVLTN